MNRRQPSDLQALPLSLSKSAKEPINIGASSMRALVIGTSKFTLRCIDGLLDSGWSLCAIISLIEELRPNNSTDISTYAKKRRIPYHEIDDINSPESHALISSYYPDYLFSSWPKIIGRSILDIPRICCVGTHPTELPFNRGRHPLHWLIAMGISETKLSFFRMDEGVDTGNILLQIPIEISNKDAIIDVVAKMEEAAYSGVKLLCDRFSEDPFYAGIPQDHTKANYWRKRTPHDVTLDLRMSASTVLRTVRSFMAPYPCANLIVSRYVLKIVSASLVEMATTSDLQRLEPGKVIHIRDNEIRVKVDDAIIDLKAKDLVPQAIQKIEYIHPPSVYLIKGVSILGSQL
jgi:methionyl-tRNA formyltransferase